MELTADLFPAFFEEVYEKRPFPWQEKLASKVIGGEWLPSIALPTAAGKTALIDIAVYALACSASNPEKGAARRIFFVVDRRVVVDEAAERAEQLARTLEAKAGSSTVAGAVARALLALDGDAPLLVATLRGGLPRDDSWTRSPLQPAVCCSTVDQVGSSLLFRAYGSRSNYNWPIRAALAANDALIIVDEAHTAQPFIETLERVARYRGDSWREDPRPIGGVFRVVEMSATPRNTAEIFRETEEDWKNPILANRWNSPKPVRLVIAGAENGGGFGGLVRTMTAEARSMCDSGAKVIGVVANRVATARAIHEELRRDANCTAELMTGRSRPFDRDRLWERIRPLVELGRDKQPEQPIYLVATQCIEVGANIDFDALVTEVASIDALEQRFGRLNRNGRPIEAQAAIVAQSDQTAAKYVDPVYGPALAQTWHWLKKRAGGRRQGRKGSSFPVTDMGVSALRGLLADDEQRRALTMPRSHAPVLLPAHVDRLSETSPRPAVEPEPALFLHGPQSGPADVLVVWRADLREENRADWAETVARVPPRPEEAISIPIWALRRWLADRAAEAELTDVEGSPGEDAEEQTTKPVLRWRGPEESEEIPGNEVRPGDTVVVPAEYGGCDQWGWNPNFRERVEDVAERVSLKRGMPVLRFEESLIRHWVAQGDGTEARTLVAEIRQTATVEALCDALRRLSRVDSLHEWVRDAAGRIARARPIRQFRGAEDEDGICALLAVSGRYDMEQESLTGSYTRQIELEPHLKRCKERAAAYAQAAGLPPQVAAAVEMAADLHDVGKADGRFQSWLRSGIPVSAADALLAKSGGNGFDRATVERARRLAGYPKGGRHELQSVALIESDSGGGADLDRELLLHLVASHHGRCRPFAPVVDDDLPVEVRYKEMAARSDHGLASAGSGICERFWKLTRRYGWWGLAYLEALVRLADQLESEAEQQPEEEGSRAVAAD